VIGIEKSKDCGAGYHLIIERHLRIVARILQFPQLEMKAPQAIGDILGVWKRDARLVVDVFW